MLVRAVEAAAFGTNCWVLASSAGEECVVVDPGFGVAPRLREVLEQERLRPAAVLLTHGHADHVWSVTPVCAGAEPPVAVHVHPEDWYRLRDPLATLDPGLRQMLAAQFDPEERWQEPEEVVDLPGAAEPVSVRVAGLELHVHHTPGHTEGSVVFATTAGSADDDSFLVSGDLLFAGSIGRTDLAGGDPAAMTRSLREVLPRFDDDVTVLPGHGPTTTMAAERARNPFLRAVAAGQAL
jgi:hydroxyacylglutathione hydrolase